VQSATHLLGTPGCFGISRSTYHEPIVLPTTSIARAISDASSAG